MKTIVIEANEHTARFRDALRSAGLLPNTERFFREARIYTTHADDPNLDPWVQWATIHTGVPQSEHGLTHLGEAPLYTAPRSWDRVVASGGTALVFGSMNASYRSPFRGWFVPDPWNADVPRQPASLDPYFTFVQAAIAGQMGKKPLDARAAAGFLRCVATHGIRPGTLLALARQVLAERLSPHDLNWRRVCLHDEVQWDLFRFAYRKLRPDFATFFTDAVAHLQHHYWRHALPEDFELTPPAQETESYGKAIEYGYRRFDGLLGRLMDLAGDELRLVYLTALSQQPYTLGDEYGGKHIYKPNSFERFLEHCGVEDEFRVEPVMANQANVYFESADAAKRASELLLGVRMDPQTDDERPMLRVLTLEPERLMVSCGIYTPIRSDARFEIPTSEGRPARSEAFYSHFRQLGVPKSGFHHRQGSLWIREPDRRHEVCDEVLDLTQVGPLLVEGIV